MKSCLAVAAREADDGANGFAFACSPMPVKARVAGTANALLITSLRFIEISLILICRSGKLQSNIINAIETQCCSITVTVPLMHVI
jgi:hypothetical protein